MIYRLSVPGPMDDVPEVRLLEWQGGPGRAYAPGDLVVELETHKALFEIRASQPGVLRRVLCAEGEWRPAGALLAIVSDAADEPLPDDHAGLPEWPVDAAFS